MNPGRGGWLILITLVIALVLSAAHLPLAMPDWLAWLRPGWVVMVVLFWVIEVPDRFGLISAWLVGALVDVINAEPLGLNGLVLAVVTYVTWRFYERLRMYRVVQQAVVVLLLVMAGDLFRLAVLNLTSDRPFSFAVLLSGVVSALVWPLLAALLARAKLRVGVE